MIDPQKGYSRTNTMREVVQDNNLLLHAISRFSVAYGFGDGTVQAVCAANGVHTGTFLAVCNLISGYPFDLGSVSLKPLVGYLRESHKSITGLTLPHIRYHLVEGIGKSPADKVALMLIKFFDEYTEEVRAHMDREEHEIFRYAETLLQGTKPDGLTLSGYVARHESMSKKLSELKDVLIYNYNRRDNDMLSSVLLDIILCERDLATHFEVENRLLVPLVCDMEKRCRVCLPAVREHIMEQAELGRREKEIVHYIAKGLTNKQISDKLCLSAHTVATHRRNICAKLDIHSASGLTLYAIKHRLIDISEIQL